MTKFEEEYMAFAQRRFGPPHLQPWTPDDIELLLMEEFRYWQPQQALPVVKDFVAEWYEGHKDNLDFEIYNFCCDLFKTKSEFATWFGNAENNSISTLIKMKDGYTVEKNIVSPCPVCGYENVKSNFCSICGRKNDYE